MMYTYFNYTGTTTDTGLKENDCVAYRTETKAEWQISDFTIFFNTKFNFVLLAKNNINAPFKPVIIYARIADRNIRSKCGPQGIGIRNFRKRIKL
jgi:hypothetical protein